MTIEYNPNRVTVVAGTAAGQDFKETYHDDANIYELTEVAATPGFDIILDFDKFRVDSDFVNYFKLEIVGWYDGGPVHNKKIYIYNWATDTWDAFTPRYDDLPKAAAEGTYTFYKEMGFGLQEEYNGKVRIKISHDSPVGTAGHKLYLNRVKLSGIVLGVIEGAGQYSGGDFGTGPLYSTTTTTTTT